MGVKPFRIWLTSPQTASFERTRLFCGKAFSLLVLAQLHKTGLLKLTPHASILSSHEADGGKKKRAAGV
jgi:hypothetical protein